jgi:hypothetical protein
MFAAGAARIRVLVVLGGQFITNLNLNATERDAEKTSLEGLWPQPAARGKPPSRRLREEREVRVTESRRDRTARSISINLS